MLTISPGAVRGWEDGTDPLFSVSYDQLRHLASALDEADAKVGHEIGDLVLASQCDLLMTGMLREFEDYAEVPPVDLDGAESEAARDLLRWALGGIVPERYRPWAPSGRLLASARCDRFHRPGAEPERRLARRPTRQLWRRPHRPLDGLIRHSAERRHPSAGAIALSCRYSHPVAASGQTALLSQPAEYGKIEPDIAG